MCFGGHVAGDIRTRARTCKRLAELCELSSWCLCARFCKQPARARTCKRLAGLCELSSWYPCARFCKRSSESFSWYPSIPFFGRYGSISFFGRSLIVLSAATCVRGGTASLESTLPSSLEGPCL